MSEDEIIGDIEEALFEEWQIKLLKKLKEWFPQREDDETQML